ncbi:hypothetical protein BLNAU_19069 [Blattamonas nauphoetae]|uniref:Uncharacterized protein n=1 Tax=Blattamonas nauphoetae TaxID=2049346 RepID=A0ABQ9X311_9EUKA|nr:hypothetical protein BLNAU_19069 [Blattamonas nauphoetae]
MQGKVKQVLSHKLARFPTGFRVPTGVIHAHRLRHQPSVRLCLLSEMEDGLMHAADSADAANVDWLEWMKLVGGQVKTVDGDSLKISIDCHPTCTLPSISIDGVPTFRVTPSCCVLDLLPADKSIHPKAFAQS